MGKPAAKQLPCEPAGNREMVEKFLYFHSGAAGTDGLGVLSNLRFCPGGVVCKKCDITFPTTEHAYQSRKFPLSERHRFAVGGDLADWRALRFFFPRKRKPKEETQDEWVDRLAKKKKHWSKKKMIGILAKMASKPEHAKNAGLSAPKRVRQGIFYKFLRSKYERDERLMKVLLSTGSAHLIEFARGAKLREDRGGAPERWAANVTDGVLYGDNRMGLAMMRVREYFQFKLGDA